MRRTKAQVELHDSLSSYFHSIFDNRVRLISGDKSEKKTYGKKQRE